MQCWLLIADQDAPSLWERLYEPFAPLVEGLPSGLAALVIFAAGLIVAWAASRLTALSGTKLGLQAAARRSGLAEAMRRSGIARDLPDVLGLLVFWILLGLALVTAFGILDMHEVPQSLAKVAGYIPRLLAASVLVIVGLTLARLLQSIIAVAGRRGGTAQSQWQATLWYYVAVLLTGVAAAIQLGIRVELLEQFVLIVFAAAGLAAALACGLGGRAVLAEVFAGYILRLRFQAGDEVRLGELRGIVREIGAISTILEIEEDNLTHRRSIPNSRLLSEGIG